MTTLHSAQAQPEDKAEASNVSPPLIGPGTRLRLRHLQCFLAVARLGRLRAAADALAVTQPAITKTLNELEDILGVILFERSRRGVTLTPAAQAFLRHAAAAAQALEQAVDSVRHESGRAPLRVASLPTVTAGLLAPAITRFHTQHAEVRVCVFTGNNLDLIRMLRANEVDVAVARLSDPREIVGLSFEFLYAEPLAVVVRPGHPLARSRRLAASALARYRMVLPPAGTLIRHSADSYLSTAGAGRPEVLAETISVTLARSLVLSTDAVWFTAPSAVAPDLLAGQLVRLKLDTTGTEEPVGLLLRTDTTPAPLLASFLAALRECAVARSTPG